MLPGEHCSEAGDDPPGKAASDSARGKRGGGGASIYVWKAGSDIACL